LARATFARPPVEPTISFAISHGIGLLESWKHFHNHLMTKKKKIDGGTASLGLPETRTVQPATQHLASIFCIRTYAHAHMFFLSTASGVPHNHCIRRLSLGWTDGWMGREARTQHSRRERGCRGKSEPRPRRVAEDILAGGHQRPAREGEGWESGGGQHLHMLQLHHRARGRGREGARVHYYDSSGWHARQTRYRGSKPLSRAASSAGKATIGSLLDAYTFHLKPFIHDLT
jgi:hypothetical protein